MICKCLIPKGHTSKHANSNGLREFLWFFDVLPRIAIQVIRDQGSVPFRPWILIRFQYAPEDRNNRQTSEEKYWA